MKIIAHYISIILLSLLLLQACNKNGDTPNMEVEDCGVENPIEDLAWLALQKENCFADIDCKTHFYSAVHNFKMVFYNQLEGALCNPNFSVTLFNCDGQMVENYSESEKTKFENEVTKIQFLEACE